MPAGIPPLNPTGDPDFNFEDAIERFARAAIAHRHGIPPELLDDCLEMDADLRREYDDFLRGITEPNWLNTGVKVFEVTESPEGEVVLRGERHAVVRSYTLYFPPSRRQRTSVHPWLLKFGGLS